MKGRTEDNPFRSKNPPALARTSNSSKRVNVGKEGETPKKFYQIDREHVYDASTAMENIREGDEESDSRTDSADGSPTATASAFLRQLAADSSSGNRPKTSRGTSHPSPDDFFNYVVPSPESHRGGGRSRLVIDHDPMSSSKANSTAATEGSVRVDDSDPEEEETEEANAEGNESHIHWSDDFQTDGTEKSTGRNSSTPPASSDTSSLDIRHPLSDNYLLGINLEGVSRDKQIALLGCWLFGSALRI